MGEVLTSVAATLGIDAELRLARQMATWERIVDERVPATSGASTMLSVQPPALVVSASSPLVAQELRLRQHELLGAFTQAPDGQHLLELRVVVRAAGARDGHTRLRR
ncbi:MAG: DciA family protein [Candidatus Limnocylindrales bacterium]